MGDGLQFFILFFLMGGLGNIPVSKLPSFRISKLPSYQVSKFPSFQVREGGLTNERPGTDHVISGPMRGLEKTAPDGANTHTHTHPDMATL